MKRILSMLLAVALCFSLLPASAFAETTDAQTIKLKISQSEGEVYLYWNEIESADKYIVYTATDVDGEMGTFTKFKEKKAEPYSDTGDCSDYGEKTPGENYYYKVVAYQGDTELQSSNIVKYTNRLESPWVTVMSDASTGSPKIKWGKIDNADRYEIWRSTSKKGTYDNIATTTKSSYIDKANLTIGKTYYYKVKAVYDANSAGNSKFSPVESVKKVKADKKLADAISKCVKNGKVKEIATLQETLKRYPKDRLSELGYYQGGLDLCVRGDVNYSEVFNVKAITDAGAKLEQVNMGGGDPGYFYHCLIAIKKNGIVYEQVDFASYGINVFRVRTGSSEKEIKDAMKSLTQNYYSSKYWTVSAEKFKNGKKGNPTDCDFWFNMYARYQESTGYGKYAKNTYMLKIKNKSNSKKNGWAFVTVVPSLERIKTPVITVKNLKNTENIKVSWKKKTGANKYEVWRKAGSKGSYKKVCTTSKLSYTDKKTSRGKKYYYKVKAVKTTNKTINSKFSKVKSITCN